MTDDLKEKRQLSKAVETGASRGIIQRIKIGKMLGILLVLMLSVPLATLVIVALGLTTTDDATNWSHLLNYVLPNAAGQTILLLTGVGIGTTILGVGTAWLVVMCQFPGYRTFRWLLVLPLAMPTYIVAYCYVEILDYSGFVQSTFRSIFGFQTAREYWFPDIHSLEGAAILLSLVLYPYVYLATRIVFMMQGASVLDASRSLGAGPFRMFFSVALPLARPAIVVGITLALLETLNDIGAVEILGVHTLTFAVYDTWLNKGSLTGAAQIAMLMLALVVALMLLERWARRKQNYTAGGKNNPPSPFKLKGLRAWLATLFCLLPIMLGFFAPAFSLLHSAFSRLSQLQDPNLIQAVFNSLAVSTATALICVVIGFSLAYAARIDRGGMLPAIGRIASLGYAIPGTVLAIGVLVSMAALDNWFDGAMRNHFGYSTGLLITGSSAIVIYACTVRFLAMSFGTLEAGLTRISPNIDMAAKLLGRSNSQCLRQVHLPLMRRAIAVAGLLVFVETMKELSATILLRPFDFNTLATYILRTSISGGF